MVHAVLGLCVAQQARLPTHALGHPNSPNSPPPAPCFFPAGKWAKPCIPFTTELAAWYAAHKDDAGGGEVIYVSADKTSAQFSAFAATMPWLSLPFELRRKEEQLSVEQGVEGVPTLHTYDVATGALVSRHGRAQLFTDPSGVPWPPILPPTASVREALELFPELLRSDGTTAPPAALRGAPFALYFSASWGAPCQAFTPVLAGMHRALRAAGTPFEVVLVSACRAQAQFEAYFAGQPWLALPRAHARFAAAAEWLQDKCGVDSIPALALFDGSGALLHANALERVRADPAGARFPWPPAPWERLEVVMQSVNEQPLLLALTDLLPHPHALSEPALAPGRQCDTCRARGDAAPLASCAPCAFDQCAACLQARGGRGGAGAGAAAAAAAEALLQAVAAPYFVAGAPSPAMRFALAGPGPAAASVRSFCGLAGGDGAHPAARSVPRYVIIDVPRRLKALLPEAAVEGGGSGEGGGGSGSSGEAAGGAAGGAGATGQGEAAAAHPPPASIGLGSPRSAEELAAWVQAYLAGTAATLPLRQHVGAGGARGGDSGGHGHSHGGGHGHSHGGEPCGGHGHGGGEEDYDEEEEEEEDYDEEEEEEEDEEEEGEGGASGGHGHSHGGRPCGGHGH